MRKPWVFPEKNEENADFELVKMWWFFTGR
jgi:hypothetical protein